MPPGLSFIGLLAVVAAGVVLAIYRFQVLKAVILDSNSAKSGSRARKESEDARALNQALDAAARERRAAEVAHRRMGPLSLDTVRAVESAAGTTTVLMHNVGGIATDVVAVSDHASIHVNPANVLPDDNVQLTFLDIDDTREMIEFALQYTNAAGAPATYELILDRREMNVRP